MIEQQISDIPLSPQISPIKEQPSQEEYEPSSPEVVIKETPSQEEYEPSSRSETTKVETIVATTEEAETRENNKLTLTPLTVEETSLSKEVIVKSIENPTNEQEVNNNNNNTINIEDKTDCQESSSPLLTYVTPDDKLDSLQQTSASSQEATATMPLQHLECEVIYATTWDGNY